MRNLTPNELISNVMLTTDLKKNGLLSRDAFLFLQTWNVAKMRGSSGWAGAEELHIVDSALMHSETSQPENLEAPRLWRTNLLFAHLHAAFGADLSWGCLCCTHGRHLLLSLFPSSQVYTKQTSSRLHTWFTVPKSLMVPLEPGRRNRSERFNVHSVCSIWRENSLTGFVSA